MNAEMTCPTPLADLGTAILEGPRVIDLDAAWKSFFGKTLPSRISAPLQRLLGVAEMNERYLDRRACLPDTADAWNFWPAALRMWDIDFKVDAAELANIPATGPVMLVANHPFGFMDGLVLAALATRIRPDYRCLTNDFLGGIPELRNWIIGVNPFGDAKALRDNVSGMRKAMEWLKAGRVLATFPAGAVSHYQVREGTVVDGAWHTNTARMIRRTQATVVPVYFEGGNSLLFQLSGLINGNIRTALLPREFITREDRTLKVRIGQPIPASRLIGQGDDAHMVDFLRTLTYGLARKPASTGPFAGAASTKADIAAIQRKRPTPQASTERPGAPLAAPVDSRALAREIGDLPASCRLASHGEFDVLAAHYWQIPLAMRQIGIERERAFRLVGEGTGEPIDTDRYDRHYIQLFLWDRQRRAIAGGYRMGEVPRILRHLGIKGLYTRESFRFTEELFERTGQALELGRSFIAPEYQRKANTLPLLWKGIGTFVMRNPRYRALFGAVSMSNAYHPASRDAVVATLGSRWCNPLLDGLATPVNPPPRPNLPRFALRTLTSGNTSDEGLSALISAMESDSKGLPVLIKHYLKLNASVLAFNIDPNFGNTLDALIVVDFRKADPRLMRHYFGADNYASYMAHHNRTPRR